MKMFYLYLVIWAWVHFRFQRSFWVPEKTGKTVFTKYGDESDPRVAQKVYYQKAIQFFIFAMLAAFGLNIVDAFTIGCVAYCICLFSFFPVKTYHWLNGILVFGMVVERAIFYLK